MTKSTSSAAISIGLWSRNPEVAGLCRRGVPAGETVRETDEGVTMRVLVTETTPGASALVSGQLQAAGHEVLRCHAAGAPAFPCSGMADGPCPIETGIDVALTVRRRPQSSPAPAEDGVLCALRARVPVVIAGQTLFQPFSGFDAVEVPGDADVVAAVEAAARDRRPQHEAVAGRVLETTLTTAGETDPSDARVTRSRDGLAVELCVASTVPREVQSRAAVRVVGALREFDRHAPRIDVSFAT